MYMRIMLLATFAHKLTSQHLATPCFVQDWKRQEVYVTPAGLQLYAWTRDAVHCLEKLYHTQQQVRLYHPAELAVVCTVMIL